MHDTHIHVGEKILAQHFKFQITIWVFLLIVNPFTPRPSYGEMIRHSNFLIC